MRDVAIYTYRELWGLCSSNLKWISMYWKSCFFFWKGLCVCVYLFCFTSWKRADLVHILCIFLVCQLSSICVCSYFHSLFITFVSFGVSVIVSSCFVFCFTFCPSSILSLIFLAENVFWWWPQVRKEWMATVYSTCDDWLLFSDFCLSHSSWNCVG